MTRLLNILGVAGLALLIGGCPKDTVKPDDKPAQPAAGGDTGQPAPKKVEVSETTKLAFADAVAAYQQQKKSGRFDYEDLLSRFNGILEADPKAAEAHYNLGCVLEAMRKDEEAQKHYQQALELRPDLTLAAANWGAMLARQGKLDQAIEVYKRALSKDAKNSAVLLNMASVYLDQKKYDIALQKSAEVLVRDPTNVGAYRIMSSAYLEKDDLDMAHLLCLRGLLVKKDDPILYNTLGLVLLKQKKVPEALAQFRAALEGQPDMISTRLNIAKIALDYKDFRVAKEEFTRVLEYEPSHRPAAFGLAIAVLGAGEIDASKAQFLALAEKYPKDPSPHQWLCRLALRNFNSPADAKQECKKCIDLAGVDSSSDHPCVAMAKESVQSIEMEKKMKKAEADALEEQKKLEEKLAMLAKLRKDTVDREWEKGQKECLVLPPQKLDTTQLEFVLEPLAITPEKAHTVKLLGYLWEDVKDVFVGTIKTKWHKVNEYTLEMVVPKDLELGPWDVLIRMKDKSEMYFGGGLWVGEKPKCGEAGKPGEASKPPEGGEAKPPGGGDDKPATGGDKPKEPDAPGAVQPAGEGGGAPPAKDDKAGEPAGEAEPSAAAEPASS